MSRSRIARIKLAWAVLRGQQTWPDGYPTPWAYEQACKALWKHLDENKELKRQLAVRVVSPPQKHSDAEFVRMENAWRGEVSRIRRTEFGDLQALRQAAREVVGVYDEDALDIGVSVERLRALVDHPERVRGSD